MYIVTGGAGFIGANIVHGLNKRGIKDILVVDNLEKAVKFLNIRDLDYADFMDKREFRKHLARGLFDDLKIDAIFHEGACSDTMEYDGRYMMDNNFTYSKELLHFALENAIPYIYASSAATYGASSKFVEERANEKPLNVYGFSKLFFDRYASQFFADAKATIAGLRYFNVYGPREQHKGKMASQHYQIYYQLRDTGFSTLFEGSGGYEHGGQRRDFIYVGDIVDINFFLSDGPPITGIFNAGTGKSRSFNAIPRTLIKLFGKGEIRYREMPEVLKDKYQSFTEADMSRLRAAGFNQEFTSLEDGIGKYFKYLNEQ